MATYVYECSEGHRFESSVRGKTRCHSGPDDCSGSLRRDYRAEGVGYQVVGLARERERGGSSAVRDLFLPTAKELAGPGDPDGTKAIRTWNDEHDPKPGNARPMRPEGPKEVF
ncbi:MAG: hypothetical protein V4510_12940 [bacterium]